VLRRQAAIWEHRSSSHQPQSSRLTGAAPVKALSPHSFNCIYTHLLHNALFLLEETTQVIKFHHLCLSQSASDKINTSSLQDEVLLRTTQAEVPGSHPQHPSCSTEQTCIQPTQFTARVFSPQGRHLNLLKQAWAHKQLEGSHSSAQLPGQLAQV